jgi:hypothetical protein
MRVIAERDGTVLLRKEDGTYLLQDDEGVVISNLPTEHRNSVKTLEWDDMLMMNKALTSKFPHIQVGMIIEQILEGRPKR